NTQVSLSGGAATNGAFVTALTDAKGYFSLAFNVSDELGDTLKNATLMISAPGYISLTKQVAVTSSISGGSQFTLIQNTEAT
ncbi:carboxypeptidase regulatory-like domain-containing protein, partial [Acinetobacter variabilis]